jgi:hypothetical protein
MNGEVLDTLDVVIVAGECTGSAATVSRLHVLALPQCIQGIPLSWSLLIFPKTPAVHWSPRNRDSCK